ncbi:MAG: hypothetical protein HOG89_01025 [Candidatus Peribacter sp.]|jgi:hypothetical protein|nr:hypothetical protein [Candidatus Peribacter sp.]MBT4393230.1 hypothetical protein [Candidatus Peribacter sp.]MBT4601125.1 hypothetical protein [Candidatus Peribacter sp.]MBT5148915.1 hypothetical protein [Candidatus Peribacter sp.]MBT5637206.1 hypothetical protein [Candidatus Peribacter sp.]
MNKRLDDQFPNDEIPDEPELEPLPPGHQRAINALPDDLVERLFKALDEGMSPDEKRDYIEKGKQEKRDQLESN